MVEEILANWTSDLRKGQELKWVRQILTLINISEQFYQLDELRNSPLMPKSKLDCNAPSMDIINRALVIDGTLQLLSVRYICSPFQSSSTIAADVMEIFVYGV